MVILTRFLLLLTFIPFLGDAVVSGSVLDGTVLSESKLGLISRRNRARKQAESAYRLGHYQQALGQFRQLMQQGERVSPLEHLAVAHVYFKLNQFAAATDHYAQVDASVAPPQYSMAAAQLGVLACYRGDTATALAQFERALLSDPENQVARLNFEWLKPRYSGKKHLPKPQKMAASAQRQVTQQVVNTAQQKDKLNPFRNLNMTEEQARRLLDALQADDLPYALARRRQAHRNITGTAGRW